MQPSVARLPATKSSWIVAVGAMLAALCAMIVLFPASDTGQTHWLIDEGGPVETMTAVLYVLVILLLVLRGGLGLPMLRGYAIVLVLAFLLARELDLHKQFTSMGIFRMEYYRSPDVGSGEKAVVVAVLAIVGLAVGRMLWDLDRFWWGLRDRDPAMIAVALGIVMAGAAKLFDGSAAKLAQLGYIVEPEIGHGFTKVEEILELGIPVFALLAILSYFASSPKQGVDRP